MSVTRELRQAGAQSATFLVISSGGDQFLRREDWLKLPKGKLRNFLLSAFVTPGGAPDAPAMMRALASIGGDAALTAGGATPYGWFDVWGGPANDEYGPVGTPILLVGYTSPAGTLVRLTTAYSASE